MTRPLPALITLALLAGLATAQTFKPAKTASEVKARLATIIDFKGIDDPKVTVGEALDMLKKRYGVNIELRPAALFKLGIAKPDTVEVGLVPAMNASLDRVLRKVIGKLNAGAVICVVGDTVQISTV